MGNHFDKSICQEDWAQSHSELFTASLSRAERC